eukprot:362077-Chlamydomonas_euryale.AAC.13
MPWVGCRRSLAGSRTGRAFGDRRMAVARRVALPATVARRGPRPAGRGPSGDPSRMSCLSATVAESGRDASTQARWMKLMADGTAVPDLMNWHALMMGQYLVCLVVCPSHASPLAIWPRGR